MARNGTLTMLAGKARVIAEAIDELDREVSVDSRSCVPTSTRLAPAILARKLTLGQRGLRRTDRAR